MLLDEGADDEDNDDNKEVEDTGDENEEEEIKLATIFSVEVNNALWRG